MKCQYCYTEQNDDTVICEKCGANLKPALQDSKPAAPQTVVNPNPQNPYGQNPYAPQYPPYPYGNPYGQAPIGQNLQQPQPQQNPYQQNPYTQYPGQFPYYNPYGAPAANKKTSMILGIIGLSLAAVGFFIFGFLSFASIVLGIIAIVLNVSEKKAAASGRVYGYSVAGLILGISSVAVGVIFSALWISTIISML